MQQIELVCPVCGHSVTVTSALSPPSGGCPSCSTRIEVAPAAFAVLASRGATPASGVPQSPPLAPVQEAPEIEELPLVEEQEPVEELQPLPAAAPKAPPSPAPEPGAPSAEQAAPGPTPPKGPVIQIQRDEEAAAPRRKTARPAAAGERGRERQKGGTSLDLFEAYGDPTRQVLSEYWHAQSRPGWRKRRAFIIYLGLLAVLAILVVVALLRTL